MKINLTIELDTEDLADREELEDLLIKLTDALRSTTAEEEKEYEWTGTACYVYSKARKL